MPLDSGEPFAEPIPALIDSSILISMDPPLCMCSRSDVFGKTVHHRLPHETSYSTSGLSLMDDFQEKRPAIWRFSWGNRFRIVSRWVRFVVEQCMSMHMQNTALSISPEITGNDAHDEGDDDHPYRTVCFPFSTLVHLGAHSRSGAKPPVAKGCP